MELDNKAEFIFIDAVERFLFDNNNFIYNGYFPKASVVTHIYSYEEYKMYSCVLKSTGDKYFFKNLTYLVLNDKKTRDVVEEIKKHENKIAERRVKISELKDSIKLWE